MKQKEVTEYIYNALKAELALLGFRLNKRLYRFRKKTENGYFDIIISISNYAPDYYLRLGLSIRIDKVDGLIENLLNLSDKGERFVIVKNIGDLLINNNQQIPTLVRLGDNYAFKIVSMNDLITTINIIKQCLSDIIIPFFEEYNSLINIHELINIKEIEGRKYPDNAYSRIVTCYFVDKSMLNLVNQRNMEKMVSINDNLNPEEIAAIKQNVSLYDRFLRAFERKAGVLPIDYPRNYDFERYTYYDKLYN